MTTPEPAVAADSAEAYRTRTLRPVSPPRLGQFLLLVLAFSIPLWITGGILDATQIIPIKLPLSAIQFVAVFAAALIVVRVDGQSVRLLLMRGIDVRVIRGRFWAAAIYVIMPVIVLASFAITVTTRNVSGLPPTPIVALPVFLAVYAISGYCEQLGWTALMTDTLLARTPLVVAGLITGVTWAVWHIIPFIQTHNAPAWIFWQCTYSVIYRVLLTKAYVLSGRSVFATIALHATYNTAFSMLPFYGSSYDPMIMAAVTFIASLLLLLIARPSAAHRSAVATSSVDMVDDQRPTSAQLAAIGGPSPLTFSASSIQHRGTARTERLRLWYAGGRPNVRARRANRRMARLAGTGLLGWWLIQLRTTNPDSGVTSRIPLVTAHLNGEHYVVSMLGRRARWVHHARAANGHVSIRVGWVRSVTLVEVPVDDRAPIIKNYLQRAPGARPHIPVDKSAPLPKFQAIADEFPVFLIDRSP